MPKRLAHSPRYYYYLVAVVIIASAIVIQSLRILAPKVNSLRPSIEQFLSQEIDAQVSIGKLSASWYGLRPHVLVSDVALRGTDNEARLSIGHADFTVDLLKSLLNYQWVWRKVAFSDIYLELQQNEQGQWHIAGLPLVQKEKTAWRYRSPSELFRTVAQIDLHNADIGIRFSNNKVVRTQIPTISIENTEGFHRLTASATVLGHDVFTLILEEQNGLDAENYLSGFVRLSDFPLDDIVDGFVSGHDVAAPSSLATPSSTVNTSLWFDFTSDHGFDVVGDFSFTGLPQSRFFEQYAVDFPVASQVVGHFNSLTGWSIGLRDVVLANTPIVNQAVLQTSTSDKSESHPLRLMVDRMAFGDWLPLIKKHLAPKGKARSVLDTMAPKGSLENIAVDISVDDWKASVVTANVSEVSVQPFVNIPGIENVNGFLSSSVSMGFIDISSKQLRFSPESVYDQALVFDDLDGQVAWHLLPEDNQIIVNSSNLRSDSIFGKANGYFFLDLPWEKNSRKSDFILQLGLQDSSAKYAEQFIPKKVPESLRRWLSKSILKGDIDNAGFIYRGGFSNENNGRGIQLFLDVDNVDLAYSDDWPHLTGASGRVLVDNEYTQVMTNKANVRGEPIENLMVTWSGDERKELNVAVESTVSATLGLYYLNDTLLRKKVGDTFTTWSADGNVHALVDVNIPLLDSAKTHGVAPKQSVTINFLDNNIDLKQQRLRFEKVSGALFFSEKKGLYTDKLSLSLFDRVLPITVSQQGADKGDEEYVLVKGKASVGIKPLSEWLEMPEMAVLSGELPYSFELQVPIARNKHKGDEPYLAKLMMSSNLHGIGSVLPAPLNKRTQEKRHLDVVARIHSESSVYDLQLDNVARARIVLDDGGVSSSVAIGERAQRPKLQNKSLSVNAVMDNLSVDEWVSAFSFAQTARSVYDRRRQTIEKSSLPLSYNISTNTLQYKDVTLPDVHVVGVKNEHEWEASVENDWLKGRVTLDDRFTKPMNIALDHVHIPVLNTAAPSGEEKAEIEDPLTGVDISLVKSAQVSIKDLSYQGTALGQWRFSVVPRDNAVSIEKIYGVLHDMSLSGETKGQGASLLWAQSKNKSSSELRGQLSGKGVEQLFIDLGYSPLVKSKTTDIDIDVAWAGSPAYFAVKRMTGNIHVELTDGLFVQNKDSSSTGALRVLGLFNFNTWARRLKLDFSDIYKKGVAFDSVTSRLVFDDGFIYFQEPLFLKGPSSEFTMAGLIDYPNESIDTVLVTTLPVGGNLTFAAAFAAGLPAAAGVYIVSKIFKPQVDKVSSLTYAIKGSWNNPDVKFMRLFDNNVDNEDKTDSSPSNNILNDGNE